MKGEKKEEREKVQVIPYRDFDQEFMGKKGALMEERGKNFLILRKRNAHVD